MNINHIHNAVAKAWHRRAVAQELPAPKAGRMGARYAKEQAAFLAGAMAALNAVYPNPDPTLMSNMVPASWIFETLSGRDPLSALKPE